MYANSNSYKHTKMEGFRMLCCPQLTNIEKIIKKKNIFIKRQTLYFAKQCGDVNSK